MNTVLGPAVTSTVVGNDKDVSTGAVVSAAAISENSPSRDRSGGATQASAYTGSLGVHNP
jgi:hypothetical protein